MYEHLERLFQGLVPMSEYLKGVCYELADEFSYTIKVTPRPHCG